MNTSNASANEQKLDPLQRAFVPREGRNAQGVWTFKTIDKTQYQRRDDGSIRRMTPKSGKSARRAEKRARRQQNNG
jgi:hypothetical protein